MHNTPDQVPEQEQGQRNFWILDGPEQLFDAGHRGDEGHLHVLASLCRNLNQLVCALLLQTRLV